MMSASPTNINATTTKTNGNKSPRDRRIEVMGGVRHRKAGYCGHVPLMSAFDPDDNPFTKIQQNKAVNRMTQDNVSLRKGMSSQTSYRAVMEKIEEPSRSAKNERDLQDSPRAPQLEHELFGTSPPRPKLVSGFSGHRPHYHFLVGEGVNAATKEPWRDFVFENEKEQHHHSHPRARPISEIIVEKRELQKKEDEERKKRNLEKYGTEESPYRGISTKNLPVC